MSQATLLDHDPDLQISAREDKMFEHYEALINSGKNGIAVIGMFHTAGMQV